MLHHSLHSTLRKSMSLAARLRNLLRYSLKHLQTSLLMTLKTCSTYLCCLFYIGLALERPTALGFVFCLIVFAGSLKPTLIFERGTPVVLTYTICYAMTRYAYSMLTSVDSNLSLGSLGEEIGLSGMDPFDYGWFPATSSVFIIFTLCFIIKIHGIDTKRRDGRKSLSSSSSSSSSRAVRRTSTFRRITTVKLQKLLSEWYEKFEGSGGLRILCLCLIYTMSILGVTISAISSETPPNILDLIHLAIFSLFTSSKTLCKRFWTIFCLYLDIYILIHYFWHFTFLDDLKADYNNLLVDVGLSTLASESRTSTSFVSKLLLPLILHVLAIRQRKIYEAKRSEVGRKRRFSFKNENNFLMVVTLLTIPMAFFVCLYHLATLVTDKTPLSLVTTGYFLLFLLTPLLICVQPTYKPFKNKLLFVNKLSCYYAGICLCSRFAFRIKIVGSFVTGLPHYTDMIGLGGGEDGYQNAMNFFLIMLSVLNYELHAKYLSLYKTYITTMVRLESVRILAPFLMGFSCFVAALRSISLSGLGIMMTGLILLLSENHVRARLWRITGLISFFFAVTSSAFQFPLLNPIATAGAYWYGLKRPAGGVPNPFVEFDEDAIKTVSLTQLEPSILGFATCVWFAAFFGHVNGSFHRFLKKFEEESEGVDDIIIEIDQNIDDRSNDIEMVSVGSGGFRQRTVFREARESADNEEISDDNNISERTMNFFDAVETHTTDATDTPDTDFATTRSISVRSTSRRRLTASEREEDIQNKEHAEKTVKKLDEQFQFISTTLVEGKFLEISVMAIFISAVNHCDMLGLFYLLINIWILCNLTDRSKCRHHWLKISGFYLISVFGQYWAVLRNPPIQSEPWNSNLDNGGDVGTRLFGGPWCGIFRQFTPTANNYNVTNPFGWNEWAGVCIPNTYKSFLTTDFVVLLILAYTYVELKINLGPRGIMSKNFVNSSLRRLPSDVVAFVLFVAFPYCTLLTSFLLATMTFNLLSFLYVPIIMVMVIRHSNIIGKLHIGRSEKMWTPLLAVSLGNLIIRFLFQAPMFKPSHGMDSWQVLFGFRKAHSDNTEHWPKLEMQIDLLIAVMVCVQIFLLRRDEIKFLIKEKERLKTAEDENGNNILITIENVRMDVMDKIRDRFRALNDYMVLVASERNEANLEVNWEQYLLKNRILGKQQTSSFLSSPTTPVEKKSNQEYLTWLHSSRSNDPRNRQDSVPDALQSLINDKAKKLEVAEQELIVGAGETGMREGLRMRKQAGSDADSSGSGVNSPPPPPTKSMSTTNTEISPSPSLRPPPPTKSNFIVAARLQITLFLKEATRDVLVHSYEDDSDDRKGNKPISSRNPTSPLSPASPKTPTKTTDNRLIDENSRLVKLTKWVRGVSVVWTIMRASSILIVYSTMLLNHTTNPNYLNIFYPVSIFGYALCFNPRSMPVLTSLRSLYLHPLVQNPRRQFWNFTICYACFTILLKLIFQLHVICVCENRFSFAPNCPSYEPSNRDLLNDQKCLSHYPELPYYYQEPMIIDWSFGLQKCYLDKSGVKTYVDMPFFPYEYEFSPVSGNYTEKDGPNEASDATLESGASLEFWLNSVFWDVAVIAVVMWHKNIMHMRGVWGKRKDESKDPNKPEKEEEKNRRILQREKEMEQEMDELELAIYRARREKNAKSKEEDQGSAGKADEGKGKKELKNVLSRLKYIYYAFREDYYRFSNDVGRKKPGFNFYSYIIAIQGMQFLYLIFFMQRADALLSSFGENSISGQYVLILFLHFCIIIVDRSIYLLKSMRSKILLQLLTIIFTMTVLHTGALKKSALAEGPRLMLWYVMEMIYLFFSAMQICYGYPPFVGQSVLTQKVHWLRGHIFVAYRAIPFFYELSLILDWACTDTTLMIKDWIKCEDISSSLYIVDCNLHFLKKENRQKGQKQPARRKFFTGTLVFLLLCIVVWLPLAVFSTGSISGEDSKNEVSSAAMSIGLKRFPDLYRVEYAQNVGQLYGDDKWNKLLTDYDEIAALSASEKAKYMTEVQKIIMYPTSGEIWPISPPSKEKILQLAISGDDVVFTVTSKFVLNSKFVQSERTVVTETVLTDEEKRQFTHVLTNRNHSFTIEGLIPEFYRLSTSDQSKPLIQENWKSCQLSMDRKNNTEWWNFHCCDYQSGHVGGGICDEGPQFHTVSAKITIGSLMEGYSIMGLYIVLIGSVASLVRAGFINTQIKILYEDLPRVDVLRELLNQLYWARMHKDLHLEEEIFRELIDIYRVPSEIFKRVGIYRHWFAEDIDLESEKRNRMQMLAKDLKKYEE